jgi:tetratricopeptide (TPR) repeat protein
MNHLLPLLWRKRKPGLAFLLPALVLAGAWPSQASFDTDDARPASVDRHLLNDARDGRLDEHSPIEAAMRAGGETSPRELTSLLSRFDQLANRVASDLQLVPSPRERALTVHRLLHDGVLIEYQTDASDVAETLRSGAYNCVSASILFVELARTAGLEAYAVQLPEHVRCEVVLDGVSVPVEMTSVESPFAATTRSGRARILSDLELLATIYYNRGVKAFDSGNLASAISLNTLALELDPDCHPARSNLLAAINNRVVELVRNHQHLQANRLLEQGLRVAPAYKPFLANQAYLRQQLP